MLFTHTLFLRTVHFCGKASSDSRNITVIDFWPVSLIALVPCNHTLTAWFPLQRVGTWPLCCVYWHIRKQDIFLFLLTQMHLFFHARSFIRHSVWGLHWMFMSFALSCLKLIHSLFLFDGNFNGLPFQANWPNSRSHNSGEHVWLVTAGCFPSYWNWPRFTCA